MTSWVRANITCANLAIATDTAMVGIQIINNTGFMWMNYYYQGGGGAGFTITHGQSVNITSFKLQCWM